MGINISQGLNGIRIDQFDYINSLIPIDVPRHKQVNKDTPCDENETLAFCRLVGKLNWVANQTRPDILFDVCQFSAKMKSPLIRDLIKVNKTLNKVKCSPISIYYPGLGDISKCKLHCFSDASLNNLESGKSAGGLLICLVNDKGDSCPLFWKSKTLQRVVRSTLAAETTAMVDVLDVGYYLSYCLSEIIHTSLKSEQTVSSRAGFCIDSLIPILAFTDNESLYRNAYSTTMVNEHRLRIDIAIVKQMLEKRELDGINWVSTDKQLADCLTKAGADPAKLMCALETGRVNI